MTGQAQSMKGAGDMMPGVAPTGDGRSWMRLIDWIWTVRGELTLPAGQSADEAFARLEPFFREPGTSFDQAAGSLSFTKKDPIAQDRMSIYDAGELRVEQRPDGGILRYWMTSRSLLFCFLAPLLFVAFGQIIVGVGMLVGPETEQADKKKKEEKEKVRELHWIDQMLGAPAPEKPKKDEKDKKKEEGKKNRYSPTSAYVFAGLFALLYIIGRILEDRLIRKRFLRSLAEG
ncbi:hypothetical protein C7451_104237 [Blastomonas natatoria]|uniref:Uncharacterized protein n=2 Tax=Blastomonas natatoria TaxID=34015 RepID=A0A2V3VA59_9SPHN|nr:hypothetical protein C7451_104237 [Blastomonas natatoria]